MKENYATMNFRPAEFILMNYAYQTKVSGVMWGLYTITQSDLTLRSRGFNSDPEPVYADRRT